MDTKKLYKKLEEAKQKGNIKEVKKIEEKLKKKRIFE